MKKGFWGAMAVGLFMFGMVGIAGAATWNATQDFSIDNSNPNGVWSYGWMPTDFSTFNLYNGSVAIQHGYSAPTWYRVEDSPENPPNILRIDDSVAHYGVSPGQLSLHPGSGAQPSSLRWTAPANGLYEIKGQFLPGDQGIIQLGVRKGADWLWQATDTGAFALKGISVNAGDSIDFVVYGGFDSGSTPLEVIISTTPSVSGFATIKGQPIAGSKVILRQPTQQPQITTTDAQGYYEFMNAKSGRKGTITINLPKIP